MVVKAGHKDAHESDRTTGLFSKLTITDQQSRFHTDAIEHGANKEIIVKDLSIAVGDKDVLDHADLNLQSGRHYVLVGRNGIGKSTLLRAMATDQIPSIPRSTRILLLGQTQLQSNTSFDDVTPDTTNPTVLQHVLRSDQRRERLLDESGILTTALEDVANPLAIVKAYRLLCHERLEKTLDDQRHLALRRSGARGKRAREVLIQLETSHEQSLKSLDEDVNLIDSGRIAEETKLATEMLASIQTTLELIDAAAAEGKARSILLGLGFSPASIDLPVSQLSGGWKTRCHLACALCQSADVLMLDEPTNYLDLPSIIWLERFITEELDPATTVIVVTHDRAFADGVAEELLILRHLKLETFRGNLSNYEIEKIKNIKWMSKMSEANEKQKKHIEKSIGNNLKAAKRAGDDKKLKQAASRRKKLDERMGMQVSSKGTRFKLNRDLGGYHLSNRAEIEIPTFDPPVKLSFPTNPADLRFPGALLSMEKINFAYTTGHTKANILQDVSLTIHLGERVGIAGLNGAGKSTLIKVAMGTLNASSGTVTRHARAKIGVYSQQAVEDLDSLGVDHPHMSALKHLMDFSESALEEKDARAVLGSLGLQGRTASDVPLSHLSGGQKVRLALAKLLWTPPHLLILDEVTTHLDADTIQSLIETLRTYEGAVLVITHDRFFMRCVVEGDSPRSLAMTHRIDDDEHDDEVESSSDEESGRAPGVVYRLSRGKLTKLEQGMEQYEKLAARASSKLGKA